MDGMLSQDEINALISGIDISSDGEAKIPEELLNTPEPEPKSDYLSGTSAVTGEEELSDVEKDAIGEVANISMGSSATTLYSLVNKKVNITTPVVDVVNWSTLLDKYEKPCVFIQIKYTQGLDGTNILVLKEHDVKVITSLMMGNDGTNVSGEIDEMDLSAISEAMNQMMGAAATSLSTMLKATIDISPPDSSLLDLSKYESGAEIAPFLGGNFVKISFRMQIEDLVDSSIMQLYPIGFARKLVKTFIETQTGGGGDSAPAPAPSAPANPMANPVNSMSDGMNAMNNMGQQSMNMQGGMGQMGMGQMDPSQMGMPQMGMPQMGMPQMGMPQMGMPQMGMPQMGMPQMGMPQAQSVNVQAAQFQNFSSQAPLPGQENIGLIMDVPLEVTVELGRTSKSISEILNFSPGTIIELDRIAGEPIDVLVNGKFVAKGEVVVIEESFGVRVTEIIK